MGVPFESGAIVGSIIFAAVGVAAGFGLSFYVKQKTKDTTMKTDNAK